MRLLKPFVTALLLVGVPVVAVLWVLTSPRFLLAEVQIGKTVQVTTEEVAHALAPLEGRHLLALSLDDVESLLVVNPWIGGAAIRKQLPNRLVVEILERSPAALLRRNDGIFYVDRTGFVIATYDPEGPVDLPILSVAAGANLDVDSALRVAAEIEALAPRVGAGLSEIEVLGMGDFRVFSAALPFPILISAADLDPQLAKLDRLLPEILGRYPEVAAVDLRFSRQIVIQPAGGPRSQEG